MKFETDKYQSGIMPEYEELFGGLKGQSIKYLEVGILKGGSLLWAKDYFGPESKIFGIDMSLPETSFWPIWAKDVTFFLANQNDSQTLVRIGNDNGLFDVIIDDGCHFAKETISTFNALWPAIKVGGIYIIEDWEAEPLHPAYKGIADVVMNIIKQRKELGIGVVRIGCQDGPGAYAAFWKKNG
jgi:cephalosporin hydroxylase